MDSRQVTRDVRNRKRRTGTVPVAGEQPVAREPFRDWRWLATIFLAVVVFYWIPLSNPETSPRWDAIDVHYSPQKYFSDHVRRGELPFWTPYVFSGFPFLADPQVGAWYPPNWPFFLVGITPKAIQAELALHALIAVVGAYLLLFSVTRARTGALVGALFYGFSGFFADHSQHVGMFSAAAWAPWLLWCCRRALQAGGWRWVAAGGLIGGCLLLAGHAQTALYSFCALGLYGMVEIATRRHDAKRVVLVLGALAALAIGLSAIQTLPALELASYSERATVDYGSSTERVLKLNSLVNLVWPTATGVTTAEGSRAFGYYLYSGLLWLPLAGLGLLENRVRNLGAVLVGVSVWYMLGPEFGLYKLGGLLPGLHSVRAPVHGWFVATLGLSLLAAGGAEVLLARLGRRSAYSIVLLALVFGDLFFWNSLTSEAAYTRQSFDALYGNAERLAQQNVAVPQERLTRYHAPPGLTLFGPLNHPLDLHLEATYGYNPLEIVRYKQYHEAAAENPLLLAGMNVSRQLDPGLQRAAVPVSPTLPRVYFAKTIVEQGEGLDLQAWLASDDPAASTAVSEPVDKALGGRTGSIEIVSMNEHEYLIRCESDAEALLRLSVPYFPGWVATSGGDELRLLRVDHAFTGVVVPAGAHEVHLEFSSTYFPLGLVVSLITLAASIAVIARKPMLTSAP